MTDTVSPATKHEIPTITEHHVRMLSDIANLAANKGSKIAKGLNQIVELLKSLSGGTHALYDKRTQVVVERSELQTVGEDLHHLSDGIHRMTHNEAWNWLQSPISVVARWLALPEGATKLPALNRFCNQCRYSTSEETCPSCKSPTLPFPVTASSVESR